MPIQVGIVGTGYVARTRAEAVQLDDRARLVTLAGGNLTRTTDLCQSLGVEPTASWRQLVEREDLDLIVVATVNREHGEIVRAALELGKDVVVEYPLSLDVREAEALVVLARQRQCLLHVEHIELLGGLHQAIKKALPQIGQVFYGQYSTLNPKHPAPQKWTYQHSLFGFPLIGALSRLHRWIDLFGQVVSVNCQSRFWDAELKNPDVDLYRGCFCQAQLHFRAGLTVDIVYGKGEVFWQSENRFTLQGELGTLDFTPESGKLVTEQGSQSLEVQPRQGIFQQDTQMILDYLLDGTPLYVRAEDSLYTLKVAEAARQSAISGQLVEI